MRNFRGEIQCSNYKCHSGESVPESCWNSRPDLRRIAELEEKVKALERLKLYVWDEFNPDWSDGLAFAIAESEEKAKEGIEEKIGFPPSDWGGSPSVFDIGKPISFAVSGGG